MSGKVCIDQQHLGIGKLPLEEFYRNPHCLDGRLSICRACYSRRSAERVMRARKAREAQGLTRNLTAAEKALRASEREANSYLERHLARREQEEATQHGEASTAVQVEDKAFRSIEQNNPCAFRGLVDGFLRQGTPRPSYSRA